LGLARAFAALVFTDEVDKEWLERSFAVYKDILDDSWAVQEWKAEGEAKGLVKGRIEGRIEGKIEGLHQALLDIFHVRFPEIDVRMMKIDSIQDTELLRNLIVKTSLAQTAGEALETLFRTNNGQGPSSPRKDKPV
jgi:predicted transposase YdaD